MTVTENDSIRRKTTGREHGRQCEQYVLGEFGDDQMRKFPRDRRGRQGTDVAAVRNPTDKMKLEMKALSSRGLLRVSIRTEVERSETRKRGMFSTTCVECKAKANDRLDEMLAE